MARRVNKHILYFAVALLMLTASCSPHPYIPEGEQLYLGTKEIKIEAAATVPDKRAQERAIDEVRSMLQYKPSVTFLGMRLPFTYPYYIDKHYAQSKSFLGRWLYKTFGTKPRLVSTANPSGRVLIAQRLLAEHGYFRNSVSYAVVPRKNDSLQAHLSYQISLGSPYVLDSISYHLPIPQVDTLTLLDPKKRVLQQGHLFNVVDLEAERNRISEALRAAGFYYFRPSNIVYKADTVQQPGKVQLRVELSEKAPQESYTPWSIGTIRHDLIDISGAAPTDTIHYKGVMFRYSGAKPPVRITALRDRIRFTPYESYSLSAQQHTTALLSYLNTFQYSDITYHTSDTVPGQLNVVITSYADKPYFSELEGIFKVKSNNQVGPGASFTVSKKNLFRGGELLSLGLQGSYEWETNRSTIQGSSWDINSYQLGVTTAITLPQVYLPFIYRHTYIYPASTRLSLSGEILNRGAFYRLGQFSGALAYTFEPSRGLRHTFTPLRLSYNHLIRRTARFDEVVDSNPVLQLAFRNQFIASTSYGFGYQTTSRDALHAFGIEANISEAGNMLSLLYPNQGERPHLFLGAPFAQYIKGTIELRYSYRTSSRAQIASRFFAGQVYSYGNMSVAPYSELFYSGGANSIRGFNVRSIGPGSYTPKESDRFSMLDRVGDIRLEANIEYRYRVMPSFEVATFVDAGNVWLLRPDSYLPGGEIRASKLLNDIALGTGLGFRYDLTYLVLRLDGGIALHAPYLDRKKYFNTFNTGRPDWFAIHFAIGYPF